MLCLYSGRYEEAIGYVDLVLARKVCLEALFIKGKALYAIGQYEEALDIVNHIHEASAKSDEKMSIDKKQYLFEAKLNMRLNRPSLDLCKRLCKLCPEYIPIYLWIRNESMAKKLRLKGNDDDNAKDLVDAFNDKSISNEDFEKILFNAKENSIVFYEFSKKVRRIGEKEESVDPRRKIELSCAA